MAAPVWNTNDVPTATDFNVWLTNILYAEKTVNESVTSSTTLQDDDELFISVAANSTYYITAMIRYDGATAGDFKWQFTGPASATWSAVTHRLSGTAADVFADALQYIDALSTPLSAGALGASVDAVIHHSGLLRVLGTAGTFRLQWAQDTSSGTATRVLLRSFIVAHRVS